MHDNADWRQAFQIADQALELEEDARSAYLDRACGDSAMRERVDALVQKSDSGFLDLPATQYAAPLVPPTDGARTSGEQVGPYRLIREIGRGGMGSVFLAERADETFQRRVALKVLSRWTVDERAVRRFLDERQILARLQHADIAQLYDGGVMPGGLPWFAMEYVEGIPIDRYCEEHALGLEARLRLFCRVCRAVQFAHRNLVVHRDLKPANILVQPDGSVKLLDFGIAKLLGAAEGDPLTLTGERLMTPMCASPEQIRGEPVTTASDVYALGVLLFQMLTGEYPYLVNTREPYEVVRTVLEQDARRPSDVALPRLARQLRGDVDVIVATAMQKEATNRYGSADQLVADVEHYLAGQPLMARPQPPLVRAWKFVRRHRVAVAATFALSAIVVAFAAVSTVQNFRIQAQNRRIEQERDRAEQVSGFLAGLFRRTDPFGTAGAALSARELLDSGAARIDAELREQPQTRAQMHVEIARAYFGLGFTDRARRFVETALAIQRRSASRDSAAFARGYQLLGDVLVQQGRFTSAEQAYRGALATRGASTEETSRLLSGLATVLRAQGRFRQADSISRRALEVSATLGDSNSVDFAERLEGLAQSEHQLADLRNAEQHLTQVLTIRRGILGSEHPQVSRTMVALAAVLADLNRSDAADSLFRLAIDTQRALLGGEHPDVLHSEVAYGSFLRATQRHESAAALLDHALRASRRTLPRVNPIAASALVGLGHIQLDRGAYAAADRPLREGLALRRTLLPFDHPDVAMAEQLVGETTMRLGEYGEAERFLVRSHERLRMAYGSRDERTRTALRRLVALYEAARQPQEAERYRERLATASNAPAPVPLTTVRGASLPPAGSQVLTLPLRIEQGDMTLLDLRDWLHDLSRSALGASSDSSRDSATRFVLDGSVKLERQRIIADIRLVHRHTNAGRAQWRFSSSADSLPYMAEAVAIAVLASLGSEVPGDSAQLAATSLAALQWYLMGRAAYRHGQRPAAIPLFEEAIALDSGFVLAGMWLAVTQEAMGSAAAGFRGRYATAWRQRDRLPPAGRALLEAHLGPAFPRASGFAELIRRAEHVTRIAPEWADAWFTLSEHLSRWAAVVGIEEWQKQQFIALDNAFARNPDHLQALDNLIVSAATVGDTARVRRFAPIFLARKTEGENAYFVRWCIAVALRDSTALRELRSQFSTLPEMDLRRIAVWSDWQGHSTDDGIRAAEVLYGRAVGMRERSAAINQIVPLLMNRGHPDSVNRMLASADWRFGPNQGLGGTREFQVYAHLYWDGDSTAAVRAAERLESFRNGGKVTPGETGTTQTANCALAHWWFATRHFERAREVIRAGRHTREPAMAAGNSGSPLCEAAIEALLASLDGGAEAGRALRRLEARLESSQNVRDHMLTIGYLIAARLHEENGNHRRALQLIKRRTRWNVYLSTQLREEARLALVVGDTTAAIDAYRHYVRLRWRPEARLAHDAEQVRQALVRLERPTP